MMYFPRPAKDPVRDLSRNTRSPWSLLRECPFLCDKFPVPIEQGIGCNQGFEFIWQLTTQGLSLPSQSHPLFVREPKLSSSLGGLGCA